MRKILTLFVLLMFPLVCLAIDFQGIEIEGKATDVAKNLESKGFKYYDDVTIEGKTGWYYTGKIWDVNSLVSMYLDENGEIQTIRSLISPSDQKEGFTKYVCLAAELKSKLGEPVFHYDHRKSSFEDKVSTEYYCKCKYGSQIDFLWIWEIEDFVINLVATKDCSIIYLDYNHI